eukprot:31388-Pelagococcus_subviridis.AAC.3
MPRRADLLCGIDFLVPRVVRAIRSGSTPRSKNPETTETVRDRINPSLPPSVPPSLPPLPSRRVANHIPALISRKNAIVSSNVRANASTSSLVLYRYSDARADAGTFNAACSGCAQ